MLVHVSRETGEWLDLPSEMDLSEAKLVASSRSGATEVYRQATGALYEVNYLKSGNVDVYPVATIPEGLTVRY